MSEPEAGPSVRTLVVMAIPAILVGIISAVVLWLIDTLSEYIDDFVWHTLPASFGASESTPWWIFTVLTATGGLVGLVVWLIPGHAGADSATTELIEAAPPLKVVPSLFLAVVISLAGGVSLGPENPTIAINAALAVALIGRIWSKIPVPLLLSLAFAATLGALFGTPVAAALALTGAVAAAKGPGALWDKMFLPVAAAGTGAITMRMLGGNSLAFELTPLGDPQAIYLLQGFLVAAASAILCLLAAWAFPYVHRAFHWIRNPFLMTLLGGALLGVLGMIGGPLTLFKGLEQTRDLLTDPTGYSAGQLALFAGVKVLALLVAASAGFRGGRIFPAIFIGVAVGLLAYSLFPAIPISIAVSCGVLGITLAATRDGWIAMFVGVALVGDITVLALLCIIVLPVWLIVTKGPQLVVHVTAPAAPAAAGAS